MALRIDKINLKATDVAALPVYGLITAGTNLNTLDGSVYGKYWQSENANSPTSLNYPVAAAGTLLVLKNNASSLATSCTQIYLPYNSNEIYSRSFYSSWTTWSRFAIIDINGANSTIKSLTGLTTALSIGQGGTGGKTAAEARTNLGLTTAATTSIGTDGARIPLLNGVNTWAANQTFSGTQTVFSNISPGGIEIGSLGTAGIAYIDLHSSGTGNDYDVRIRSDGGNNTVGKGTLTILADLVKLPALELTSPIGIAFGGTGALDAAGARNNFGLGEAQDVMFANIYAKLNNGNNGGILLSENYNASGQRVSMSRIYSEIQSGICKTTVHTAGNGKNAYLQYDENGNLTGINDIYAGSVSCTKSINCTGWISANQGKRVGLTTQSGGNKDIFLYNTTGDGNANSWINLIQGNWYNGYWQFGCVRGQGADIATVQLFINNQGTDTKNFTFNNSAGGYIQAPRGFKGQCVQGGWGIDRDQMGAPFYADSVPNNDGGYSPVVAGGTYSTGGYELRYSLGAISGGTGSWPRTAIHMFGDGAHHRVFEFFVDGRIFTWDNAGQWGGNFEFQRVANSDRDLKKDIEYDDGKASFDNIMKFKPSTFVYKSDKYNRVRRGVIAQDLCEIDPEYVRIIPGSPVLDDTAEAGESEEPVIIDYHDDTLGLDNNVIMLDTALATRYIGVLVEKQQVEIDSLKSEIEELKALIKALQ